MRLMCFVIAPFFAPDALPRSFSSGASASRICSAAVPTCSSSRGASRRSSRIAELRTSSRIFFESLVVICGTSSTKSPPTRPRASSSGGSPCSSAQLERPRAQKSSSSSKFRSLLFAEVVAPAREPVLERGERLVAVDVDPLGLRLDLVLELVQVGRAFSLSTAVTIEAAK